MNIELLPQQFDVSSVNAELSYHPELWDQHPWRTEHPRSPHREASDIWVRYNAIENLGPHFNDPHEAVWYPVAGLLPSAQKLAETVMEAVGGAKLGGVLITKIPAGKQVYPHVDQGWHALHYEKFAVQLAGNSEQSFCFDDACLSALPGELYQFNNQARHWVLNPTTQQRVTLICCIRRVH
jgi:hypothetical protein